MGRGVWIWLEGRTEIRRIWGRRDEGERRREWGSCRGEEMGLGESKYKGECRVAG